MPPILPGYQRASTEYPAGADNKGDIDQGQGGAEQCGKPNGFSTNIAYRSDRPKEKATAESLQQSLKRVGINLTLKAYPTSDYFRAVRRQARRSDGRTTLASSSTAGVPTGTTASASWRRSSTAGSSGTTGGSPNLAVGSPTIDKLIDQAMVETDADTRVTADGPTIDKAVMEQARDPAGHLGQGRDCCAARA